MLVRTDPPAAGRFGRWADGHRRPALSRRTARVVDELACEAGRAYASKDIDALRRITADDYMQADVRGGVLTREPYLQFVRKSELTIACRDIGCARRVALLSRPGEWTYTRRTDVGDVTTHNRWSCVWTHDADGWKHHVFQNTYINPNADRGASGYPIPP